MHVGMLCTFASLSVRTSCTRQHERLPGLRRHDAGMVQTCSSTWSWLVQPTDVNSSLGTLGSELACSFHAASMQDPSCGGTGVPAGSGECREKYFRMDPRYSCFTSAMEMLGVMHSTRPSSALVGRTLQEKTLVMSQHIVRPQKAVTQGE